MSPQDSLCSSKGTIPKRSVVNETVPNNSIGFTASTVSSIDADTGVNGKPKEGIDPDRGKYRPIVHGSWSTRSITCISMLFLFTFPLSPTLKIVNVEDQGERQNKKKTYTKVELTNGDFYYAQQPTEWERFNDKEKDPKSPQIKF
jgi:hypothetical protein